MSHQAPHRAPQKSLLIFIIIILCFFSQIRFSAQADESFKTLSTRVAALEAPDTSALGVKDFHVLSTQDGAVYRVDRHEEEMILRLSEIAGLHVPVRLFLSGDLIVALDFLTTEEESNYTDPLLEAEKESGKVGTQKEEDLPFVVPTQKPAPVPVPAPVPLPPTPATPEPAAKPEISAPVPPVKPSAPPVLKPSPAVNPSHEVDLSKWLSSIDDHYVPTVIRSVREVEQYFEELEKNAFSSRSQCYMRAHIWAYHMWHEHQVKSMKVFIFWSKSFRDSHRFKWWFHVAPFVYVNRVGSWPKELVMDRAFMDGPLETNVWATSIMSTTLNSDEMKTLRCSVISSYQDFANSGASSEPCFFRKVPMYYMQPENVENRDLKNEIQLDFRSIDLKISEKGRKFKWPWQK